MPRPTVLILGANGRLGAACVQAFAAAGWQVLAHMRRAPGALWPGGARAVTSPLADTRSLVRVAGGASAVVHAVNPIYTRWDTELLPSFRQGMAVAEQLQARFLLPANVYNFGEGMPARLLPQTPQLPTTRKGQQRVTMETELRERCAAGRLQGVVLRAGDFYGAGRGSWLDQAIVKNAARGKLVYPGPLDRMHAWAYLPDLARVFVALASAPQRSAFEQLHFEGHSLDGRALLALLEVELGAGGIHPQRGWQRSSLPWGLIRAVGVVHPMWRELARMRYLWSVSHALDDHGLAAVTGPLPSTPPADALRAALQALGLIAPGDVGKTQRTHGATHGVAGAPRMEASG